MNTPRKIWFLVVALFVLAAAPGCDSTQPSTTAIPPKTKEAWDDVKDRTSSGKYFRRVEALDNFLATEPPPMLRLEAEALREKYQEMADKQVVFDKAFDTVDAAARGAANFEDRKLWKDGDLEGLRVLMARHLVTDYEVHGWGSRLDESVTLPGRGGKPAIYVTAARLDLTRLRGSINKLFGELEGEELERTCVASCLNDVIDRKLFKTLGGELFLGLGKIDGPRLDKLAEAFWMEPDEKLMGVPASRYYAVFNRVPKDLYIVRKAIAEHGDDKALSAFREVRDNMNGPLDPRVTRHYRMWTRKVGLNEVLEGKIEYRLIDSYIGFWLRRMYDGTEPVVMKWLNKTFETYDPEFLESFESEPPGESTP